MHHKQLSWGIFSLIHNDDGKLLIKRRSDGLWDLPGGSMEPEEIDPIQTLRRKVWEEVNLTITDIIGRVGVPLPAFVEKTGITDIAIAYLCKVSGEPQCSPEAKTLAWVGQEDVFRMLRERPEGYTLVGPAGQMGRMPRMVLDGVVIGQSPDIEFPRGIERLPITDGYAVDQTGTQIVHVDRLSVHIWDRPDPFLQTATVL